MIQKIKWWLVRKLVGRTSAMINCYVENTPAGDVEICLSSRSLFYGNFFYGDWPTTMREDGSLRLMSRSVARKLDV